MTPITLTHCIRTAPAMYGYAQNVTSELLTQMGTDKDIFKG